MVRCQEILANYYQSAKSVLVIPAYVVLFSWLYRFVCRSNRDGSYFKGGGRIGYLRPCCQLSVNRQS
jgi:hypothetical protein